MNSNYIAFYYSNTHILLQKYLGFFLALQNLRWLSLIKKIDSYFNYS